MKKHRIYLAGPDVFFPDAVARAHALKALCEMYGLIGVFPLDSEVPSGLGSLDYGEAIYRANIALIDTCQGVLANMTPFRGPSMDVGTAFEMGYARAQGKPIAGYTSQPTPYKSRVAIDGLVIEDFSMIDNLMVHCAAHRIFSTAEMAVEHLALIVR